MGEHRSPSCLGGSRRLLQGAVSGTGLAAWESRSLGVCSDVVLGSGSIT